MMLYQDHIPQKEFVVVGQGWDKGVVVVEVTVQE